MRAGAIPSPAYCEGAVSELPAYIFMVPQEVSRCILQAHSMHFFENRTGKRTIQHIFFCGRNISNRRVVAQTDACRYCYRHVICHVKVKGML